MEILYTGGIFLLLSTQLNSVGIASNKCNFIEVSQEPEDAHLLLTGSTDCSVKIWDLRTGKAQHILRNHTNTVNCAKFSPDSNWVASGGNDGKTNITDLRTEKVVYWFEEPKQYITSVEFNPKTYTLTAGCEGSWINYYDLETFQIINSMSFNTSAVKWVEFYNKDEYEIVEWGFYGSDDYIRMINWEKNEQANIYSVPHDTLCDLKIDYKNELLTCLWTHNSDMILWGVNLPQISEEEQDMDVDKVPTQYPASSGMGDDPKPSQGLSSFEEQKISEDFMRKAIVQRKNENSRISQSTHAVPQPKGDSFDKSSFTHLDNLDRTTFKPNNDSVPADLDFDEFISKPSTEDQEFIDKIQDKHFHFIDTLKQRNQKLKNILSLYNPYKNLNMTLNALGQMNDIGVSNDVWAALFTGGKFVESLTMKQCLNAVPHCENLFNGKHENHVVTGAQSIHQILKHIGQDIIALRNTPVSRGVDLSREERLKICDELLEQFVGIFKGSTIKKRSKYKGNIGRVSKSLYEDLYKFLALSDTNGGNNRQAELA